MVHRSNDDKPTKEMSTILLLVLITMYLILNLSLNLYNKLIFSSYHFNFPVLIMFFHQGLLYFTLRTFTVLGFVPKPTFQTKSELVGPVMIVGFFFALNIICNNASLIYISLSLNQCLKAATPMIMIGVAYCVERKTTPLNSIAAASVVVFGSILVVLNNPGFNLTGICLCLISALTGSFQFSAAALTMKGQANLVFHVTMYTALVVTFMTLPAVVVLELDDFHEYAKQHSMFKCLGLLGLGGTMAIAYLLVTNALIVNGGSVYLTVLGNLKLSLIVLISCYVFQDKLAPINIIGILITILGFGLYSYIKKLNQQNKVSKSIQLNKDIESFTRHEHGEDDLLASKEETQSLLVNGAQTYRNGNNENRKQSLGRTVYYIEIAMAIFILSMAFAIICNPMHNLKQSQQSTNSSSATNVAFSKVKVHASTASFHVAHHPVP